MKDAYTGEAQFLAWGDGPSGPWVKILLPDSDDLGPFRGMTAAKAKMAGQLLAVKIVEVDPDNPDEKPSTPARKPTRTLSQYAAMLCTNVDFCNFLGECYQGAWEAAHQASEDVFDRAAITMRELCGVGSRALFDSDPEAAQRFHALREQFHEWMTKR